jgi:hypothetical protein
MAGYGAAFYARQNHKLSVLLESSLLMCLTGGMGGRLFGWCFCRGAPAAVLVAFCHVSAGSDGGKIALPINGTLKGAKHNEMTGG